MSLFKKNGEPNISSIEKELGLGKILSNARYAIKNSITKDARETNKKKYDTYLLGALAYLNNVSIEELTKIKPKVVWLAGLPNSGKSTKIKKEYSNFTVISFDGLILEWFETPVYDEAYQKYIESSKETKELIAITNQLKFVEALAHKKNIVLDFVNLSEAFIQKYYNFVPKWYRKEFILLDIDFNTILERNKKRAKKGKFIPAEVLKSMKQLLGKEEFKEFDWDYVERIKS